MSLAIFFSFYEKVSGADLTHVSQICPCLELSISRQPLSQYSSMQLYLIINYHILFKPIIPCLFLSVILMINLNHRRILASGQFFNFFFQVIHNFIICLMTAARHRHVKIRFVLVGPFTIRKFISNPKKLSTLNEYIYPSLKKCV